MLSDYDADAIAEVLGLAFERGPNTLDDKAHRRTPRSAAKADFLIRVGGDAMLVTEIERGDISPTGFSASPAKTKALQAHSRRISALSQIFIEKAVESGLPRHALRRVAEALAGNDRAKISALEWDVVPRTTLERRQTKLSLQESERTERIARLFVHARRALGTAAEAREFMTTPHPNLDGRSPLDATTTDLGTRRTEQLLNALEYGLAL